MPPPPIRTGIGYDIHRFTDGDSVTLGGVRIAHDRALDGHSDADVLCHAIADALLGAIGEPDIGHFFPPGDEKIRGICSLDILTHAAALTRKKNFHIGNIDTTLIAEAPKVLPHTSAMKTAIATALGISPDAIGIKATTNETLGAIGRGEGIAALATALVFADENTTA